MTQHIQDKAFLDGLFHDVTVQGSVLDTLSLWHRRVKQRQGLVLGGSCEGKVAGIVS